MKTTLADSLRIVLPDLSPALVAPNITPSLQALAKTLPPVPRAGFECRLEPNAPRVDFQQGIFFNGRELATLCHHLITGDNSITRRHPTWERLYQFGLAWQNPSSILYDQISELWFEFDLQDLGSTPLIPSIFFGLTRKARSVSDTLAIIKTALAFLQDRPLLPSIQNNMQRCVEACPEEARLTHVGFMLSRQVDALRLNISLLPPEQMMSYLEQVGWSGAKNELETLIGQLFNVVDYIKICLDVGRHIYPQVGLECSFEEAHGLQSGWIPFLDDLVQRGLCTSAKREALLAWPGYIYPHTKPVSWSEWLIFESFLRPPNQFSVLDRQLSHIKINVHPQQPLKAKAYFGYLYDWIELERANHAPSGQEAAKTGQVVPINQPSPNKITARNLARGLNTATTFLIGACNQGGWWRDFTDFSKGASDEWVTAYVGAALALLPTAQAQQTAKRAWARLIARRSQNDGWGWSIYIPADADSTTWALRLAQTLNVEESERVEQAYQFLATHWDPTHGMTTYQKEFFQDFYEGRPLAVTTDGWYDAHICVTAAAANLNRLAARACEPLRHTQHEDGHWSSYWWPDDAYATVLAAEALANRKNKSPKDRKLLQSAIKWAVKQIHSSGAVQSDAHGSSSPFATACCLRILTFADEPQQVRIPLIRATNWLLTQQKANGSWCPSAHMLANFIEHPTETVVDSKSTFTTATVLTTLHLVHNWLKEFKT